MAQLSKLREEKFFKNNQGTILESRLQHYPKNICTQILLQGKCLHDKQFTNKRIPRVFEIPFWLLQWKSAFSSTHESSEPSHVPLGQLWSHSLPFPQLCLTVEHLCLYLPSLSPGWNTQMLFSAWRSLDTLGSTASFQVHSLKHVKSFFQTLDIHISLKMVKTNTPV